MPSPKPALPAAVAALAFLSLAAAAAAGTAANEAVRSSLPAYDPKAHTEEPAKEAPAAVAPRPLKRVSDPYARLPEVKIVPGAVPVTPIVTPETKGLLVLPKMTVNGAKEKVRSLPRIFVQPPVRDMPAPPVGWETPEGRAARLTQKHITPFDQVLNGHPLPLIGGSLAAKAEQAEAREASARELNNIADLLELSLLTGTETPAEQKKLRAEYWKVFYDRPR